jgi:predicted nucleotide-binding protein (sugar kinase/HSP70/actin superfamily)
MKVSFPYMGPVLAYQKLFERLGHTVITPHRPTPKTVELGAKYSPEFICLPFKIILGNFIEAAQQGVELIVTSGGVGACRAVYYGHLSEQILHQLGYNVRVLVFDALFEDFNGFLGRCSDLKNRRSIREFFKALSFAVQLIYSSDSLQKKLNQIRPQEAIAGSSDRAWQEVQSLLENCNDLAGLRKAEHQAERVIAGIATAKGRNILKVGLVGEIYLVMENASNHDLESKLGAYGVEVVRSWYLSDWITHCFLPPRRMLREVKQYLKHAVGGHERDSIGHILEYQRLGCDGIIHLMPFGCMPELITQTVIPNLALDLDCPILSLSLDEQSGWINYQIRLEAFVELLWNRKELRSAANGADFFRG